jgi:hypothetical protein
MNTRESQTYLVDRTLAGRLEGAEGRSNAGFVDARAKACPQSGAQWIKCAGALAMFDGVGSPCTQSFGLGMFETATAEHFETIEHFFRQRGADVCHEICPLVDASLLKLLNERGYQPIEFSSVLFCPILPQTKLASASKSAIQTRIIEPDEAQIWAETAARGWADVEPDLMDFIRDLAQINSYRADTYYFLAESQGQAIAAAAMNLSEGVALLAGACTVPEWRKQGAQLALLEHRLRYGWEQGCDMAMVVAQPGSPSQRNAERQGFRIAYTRIKWRLATK